MKHKTVTYQISFYEPDSERECVDFLATTPFQAVHVGDEIVGVTWKNSAYPEPPANHHVPVARVTRVVHAVSDFDDERVWDTTLVYSKRIND